MPSDYMDRHIPKEWLHKELRQNPTNLIILDCRSSNEFGECHIRHAVNFSIPTIMLRRLAAGKIDLISTIKCRELKEKIINTFKENMFVLYDDQNEKSEIINILMKRLIQDGCNVVCLQDGFEKFKASYPEWCETLDDALATSDPEIPLMGLRSLRISNYSPTSTRCMKSGIDGGGGNCKCEIPCDSGIRIEDDNLVEILPHLFLGNAVNSEDLETLTKHNIKYILNVTPNLPNVFEASGEIKYMKIPIADHWSQNLTSYFPKSIEFIDEARSQGKGVLVHCVAGVSRSVTITLAYLMGRHCLSMNDAFCWVRQKKSNIAPNFHFMDELARFEQELQSNYKESGMNNEDALTTVMTTIKSKTQSSTSGSSGGGSSTTTTSSSGGGGTSTTTTATSNENQTFLSPANFGLSPDSGIEFDRWAPPNTGD